MVTGYSKKDLSMLIEAGVRIAFTVARAHPAEGDGFLVMAAPATGSERPILTRRGEIRVFKSLDAVWSYVGQDLQQTFKVVA